MPRCNYVILDHCKSDLISDCTLCLLLLEIHSDNSSRDLKIFVHPDMERWLAEMSSPGREWMFDVLSDLCKRRNNPQAIDDIRLEQFYALSVGPLRTSSSGAMYLTDTGNVLDLIWMQTRKQGEAPENKPCSLRSFQELTPETLQQYQQQFDLVDLDKKLVKSVARSAGALAIVSLIS